jgi:hypothetical protein
MGLPRVRDDAGRYLDIPRHARVMCAVAASAAGVEPPNTVYTDISELDDLSNGNTRDDRDIREVFPYLLRFQCHFDVAVVIHLGGHRSPIPDMLVPMHEGSFFSLYRIRHGQNCGTK